MRAFLWRVLYAVICVVILLALIPALFGVIGFPLSGALWTVFRICIAGIAALYVFAGPSPPQPF